jgi:phosphatidylglycerophosphate synthase
MIRRGLLLFPAGRAGAELARRRVAGLSLLDRQIRTLARAGLERLAVIAPAGMDLVLAPLTRRLDIRLEFTAWEENPSPAKMDEDFLLVLADHVHHHSSLSLLLAAGLGDNDLLVQTTLPPPQPGPFHRPVASEGELRFVQTQAGSAPVSTGAFLCAAGLFSLADLGAAAEDPWAFLESRAQGRRLFLFPAQVLLWRRVRDRQGVRAAKDMLFGQVTKSTSGFVSRHLNARLSIPTSKLLVETGLSPHLITVLLVLPTGLASAYLVSFADDYLRLALAGLLWQLAAVLDRCDGEVARVRLCESSFGAWFDTVTDNLAYIAAYAGLLAGMYRLYPEAPLYLYLGGSAIASLLLTLFVLYSYAHRTGSGSLQHYLRALTQEVPPKDKGLVQKLMERYGFVTKRDFFSFFIFLACLADQLQVAYWFLIAVLHLATAAVLLSRRKMIYGYRLAQRRQRQVSRQAVVSPPVVSSLEERP